MNTNMPTAAPARKVVASTTGAGVGVVTAQLVLWLLDAYVFDRAVENSVPDPVSVFVLTMVPIALAFVAGYFTPRGAHEIEPPQHYRLD